MAAKLKGGYPKPWDNLQNNYYFHKKMLILRGYC